jgi:hypothetical protein
MDVTIGGGTGGTHDIMAGAFAIQGAIGGPGGGFVGGGVGIGVGVNTASLLINEPIDSFLVGVLCMKREISFPMVRLFVKRLMCLILLITTVLVISLGLMLELFEFFPIPH